MGMAHHWNRAPVTNKMQDFLILLAIIALKKIGLSTTDKVNFYLDSKSLYTFDFI